MNARKVILALIVFSTVFVGVLGRAQTFKVRVLGAIDGKPYNDIPLIYYCDDPAQFKVTRKHAVTDPNGFAVIPYECKDGKRIRIDTFIASGESGWAGKLEECGWLEYQNIEQILNVGVISNPRAPGGIWCPARIRTMMKPIPGQVIIFVKKPTWWQKHVAP